LDLNAENNLHIFIFWLMRYLKVPASWMLIKIYQWATGDTGVSQPLFGNQNGMKFRKESYHDKKI